MTRTARFVLMGVAGLVLLTAIGLGVLIAVVNPNDFKPKIEEAVFAATGKTLILQGDLSLSVFPVLSLEAGPAELRSAGPSSSSPFARVETLSASVELLPLFSGRAEVKSLTVSGLQINLAVDAEGVPNWTMPEESQKRTSPEPLAPSPAPAKSGSSKSGGLAAIALDSLTVSDASIRYTDTRTQTSLLFTVSKMKLDSLRVGKKTTLQITGAYAAEGAKPIVLSMTADFTLPPSFAQGTVFTASGKVDETTFHCTGMASLPQTPEARLFALKGDLDIGSINIDAYTASPPPGQRDHGKSAPGEAPDKPQPQTGRTESQVRNALYSLLLDLRITAQSVTVANVPLTTIKATVKADRGQLTLKPATLNAFGTPMSIEAALDARGETIRSRFTGEWRKADVAALLRATTGKARLTGTLDLTWVLNGTGLVWAETARTLAGNVTASLAGGAVPGFNLIPAGIPGLPAMTLDLTNVRGNGTWNIAHGIAQNNDLRLEATRLSASGKGRIDIPAQTCHYNINVEIPTIPELPDLRILPVIVSGPLSALSYSIDQPALLRDAARNIFNPASKTGQDLQKAGERLGRLLSR